MTFGLSDTGFNRKTLDNIKTEIEQDQLGYFPGIDQSAESANGQQIGVYSKPAADVWEVTEAIYNALSPSTAEGVALDNAVEYNGITRRPAVPTSVIVGLRGTKSTVIPADHQTQNANTLEFFGLSNDTTITNEQQILLYVRVDVANDGKFYTIKIDSETWSYKSGTGASAQSIANGLTGVVNGGSTIVNATELANGVVKLAAKTTAFPFDTELDYDGAPVTNQMVYFTPAGYQSIVAGPKLASANTINIITTPVSGLNEVNNFEQGTLGSNTETDAELRIRRLQSLQIAGAGTLEAIRSRILNDIDDVTSVKAFENREDFTVLGRPPHSFEMIIEAPNTPEKNQEIADLLWLVKPAGIQTHGNTSANATDSNGDLQTMYFTRPTGVRIWVRVTVTKYSEETYPVNGDQLVKDAVVQYGADLESGEDIIPLRIKNYIMNAVPEGIQDLLVEISKTTPPPYVTTTIAVADNEIGQISSGDVIVIS